MPVTKKLGAPTKHSKVLVCYDFHFGISNKEEDLMFTIEVGLFSIGTIAILTSVRSYQPFRLITSMGLNIVE
jgi:hypothetical protein